MYIKLNTIRLQYTKEVNDIFILAEVPDSTMSYEKPVIVRTVDELESWFGKWFTSYDYFVELLERNISLYLYKPISLDKIRDEQYIDLSTYTMDPQIYPTKESLPPIGDPSTKYWVGGLYVDWDILHWDGHEVSNLPQNPDPGTKYLMNGVWYTCVNKQWISSRDSIGCFYIWLWDSWVSEYELPQNLSPNSISEENRDTLLIPAKTYGGDIEYCHPIYKKDAGLVNSDTASLYSNCILTSSNSKYPKEDECIVYDLRFKRLPYYYYIVFPKFADIESDFDYFAFFSYIDWSIRLVPTDPNFPRRNEIVDALNTPIENLEVITKLPENPIDGHPYYYTEKITSNTRNDFNRTVVNIDSVWYEEVDECGISKSTTVTELPSNPDIDTRYILGGIQYYYDSGYNIWINEVDHPKEKILKNFDRWRGIQVFRQYGVVSEYTSVTPKIDNFSNIVRNDGFPIPGGSELRKKNFLVLSGPPDPPYYLDRIIATKPIQDTDWCLLQPGFTFEPNYKEMNNLYMSKISEEDRGVEVWSKTIGRADPDYEDDLITLQIEELKPGEEYRFTISRLSYSEIFEGKLHPGKGEERLDYIISRDSKLVHVRFDNITDGLRTGTWKLRGATAESYNPEMYWRGLEAMFTTDSIHPDYILVPKKENWTSDISNHDYLEKFLSVCTSYSCQALIQNNLPEYMVKEVSVLPEWSEELEDYILWTLGDGQYWRKGEAGLIEETDRVTIETSQNMGDFIYNLQGDQDNRLVYFFQGMTVYGRQRPGYYLYLLGLFNDMYSASSSVINYNNFVDNPYVDEEFEETLKIYKSNYLVGNNQIFYYKDYQNGNPYTSTGWMRFAIGKITRELQRNRSAYLGKRNSVEIERGIKEVLNNIVRRFSIIDQIEILNFQVSNSENRINLHLETRVKDLVDNNIGLDITINYNE